MDCDGGLVSKSQVWGAEFLERIRKDEEGRRRAEKESPQFALEQGDMDQGIKLYHLQSI